MNGLCVQFDPGGTGDSIPVFVALRALEEVCGGVRRDPLEPEALNKADGGAVSGVNLGCDGLDPCRIEQVGQHVLCHLGRVALPPECWEHDVGKRALVSFGQGGLEGAHGLA